MREAEVIAADGGIPVVLLTGVADHVTKTQYSADGVVRAEADDYLPKPAKSQDLLQVVSILIGGGE
jgi:two-component system alkaline phosphatase synthesis response regulator PhoP